MSDVLDEDLRRLRQEFDERFARPADDAGAERRHVLAISYGETPVAIALAGAGTLMKMPPITPVPSPDRALLGLAGVRCTITAVYDLGRVVGIDDDRSEELRWMLLCRPDARVAVAFATVDGYHRVDPGGIESSPSGGRFARLPEGRRLLLDPHTLLDQVRRQGGRTEPGHENEET